MRSQQEVEENFQAIDLLKKIGRFQNFEDRDLRALVMSGRFRECEPGETIIREGEYDCWLYILLAGRLEIVKKGRTVRYLGRKGDMFGEMGVIDGSPRSATIRAVGEVQVLGIDGSVIDRICVTRTSISATPYIACSLSCLRRALGKRPKRTSSFAGRWRGSATLS